MILRVPPLLSGHENENFFDFLVFIDKYTLKCPLSICEKKVSFDNVWISKNTIFEIPYHEKLKFLVFIDKYTLKCPLSICEKKKYLAKNRNSILFCGFLKIKFSVKKILFHPHISGMVRGIELKLFPHMLGTIWRGYFFLFRKILVW